MNIKSILYSLLPIFMALTCCNLIAEGVSEAKPLSIPAIYMSSGALLCSGYDSDKEGYFDSLVIPITPSKNTESITERPEFSASQLHMNAIAAEFVAEGIPQPHRCLNLSIKQLQERYPALPLKELHNQFQGDSDRMKRSSDYDAVYINLQYSAHNVASQQQICTAIFAGLVGYVMVDIVYYFNWFTTSIAFSAAMGAGIFVPYQMAKELQFVLIVLIQQGLTFVGRLYKGPEDIIKYDN